MGNNRYLKNAKSLEVQEMAMTGEIHTGADNLTDVCEAKN